MVGEAVSDVIAGLFASWATLAALLQQRRTGQGQHVDVAMFDATLAFLVTGVGRYLFTGESARRSGNRHSFSAPFGVYRARDGHFALAVLNNKLFATLAALIGVPGFAQDARFATDELRRAHEGELAAAIEAWAGQHSVAEVVAQLEAAGVPGSPLWTMAQALESEQGLARGLLSAVDDPRLPGLRVPTQPVKFGGSAPNRTEPAPALGQHTDELMAGLLQAGGERLAALRAAGLFGPAMTHTVSL
jgi:CoA:oxalate CoA-transferase